MSLKNQIEHLTNTAKDYAIQSGEYQGLLKHISIGIQEGFITSLEKIKELIDIRLEKANDDQNA